MAGWDSYRRLFFYSLHLIFYFLLRCVQFICWNLNGVQNHINKCKKGENYESSAQLLKVWSWSEGRLFHVNHLRNFLSTQVRFVHPEYALQKHITLMTVTDKEAIFSILSPEEDVVNVRKWPFLFRAQAPTTKYILIMPISSLIRLADTLSDPSVKVIWINLTGRCGSTAVMQAFNALPDVVAISEPLCMFSLSQAYKQKHLQMPTYDWVNSEEYQNIYRSTIRLMLKPKVKEAKTIVIKPHIRTSKMDLQFIPESFPNFTMLFLYREVKEQIISMCRSVSNIDPHGQISFLILSSSWISWMIPNFLPLNLLHGSCDDPRHTQWLFRKENVIRSTEFVSFVIHYAETCFHYQMLLKEGSTQVPGFKYEHLQSDQTNFLKKLFHHVGFELTEERLEAIQEALKEDSQKGTVLDREKIKQRKVEITPDMINEANRVLRRYELPEWGESLNLPNTVSGY